MTVTIYHNPACGTSRKVLGMLRDAGIEPIVIEYLETPPSRAQLSDLAARMGVGIRSILRSKEEIFSRLNLEDPSLSDEVLLDAVAAHPILLNRPIVDMSKGALLCRPPELVLDLIKGAAGDVNAATVDELARAKALHEAQHKAIVLFQQTQIRGLIRPGVSERQLGEEIYALAKELFGISLYWHKRVVRAGRNSLYPYSANPENLILGEDDVVYLDLGPVFEEFEADLGRTFVIGGDPAKLKLQSDIEAAFAEGRRYFDQNRDVTGSQLYTYVRSLAARYGWEFGQDTAGHILGEFPHARLPGSRAHKSIGPGNKMAMRDPDAWGCKRHWILEIFFIDRERQFGGFYEELITIDANGQPTA